MILLCRLIKAASVMGVRREVLRGPPLFFVTETLTEIADILS